MGSQCRSSVDETEFFTDQDSDIFRLIVIVLTSSYMCVLTKSTQEDAFIYLSRISIRSIHGETNFDRKESTTLLGKTKDADLAIIGAKPPLQSVCMP